MADKRRIEVGDTLAVSRAALAGILSALTDRRLHACGAPNSRQFDNL